MRPRKLDGAALADYIEHFRGRVLQDALNEAMASYWLRRADQFAGVGNAACDMVAEACRNAARVALIQDAEDEDFGLDQIALAVLSKPRQVETVPEPIVCPTCMTPTSPWSCSCGETRVGQAA